MPPSGRPGAAPPRPTGQPTGKVVHDERGNAVWDWVKHAGRVAIDSTSRLLKKLEAPELKIENTQDEELRILPEGKAAGYDPYEQANKSGRPQQKPDRFGRK
jgi:hypothetical protein